MLIEIVSKQICLNFINYVLLLKVTTLLHILLTLKVEFQTITNMFIGLQRIFKKLQLSSCHNIPLLYYLLYQQNYTVYLYPVTILYTYHFRNSSHCYPTSTSFLTLEKKILKRKNN